jgi:hypothetical protein
MALETYVTTYKRLTKGNGNNNNNNNIVQSSLDPELFSLCGLLSVCELIIAGFSKDIPVVCCLLLITVVVFAGLSPILCEEKGIDDALTVNESQQGCSSIAMVFNLC